MIRTPPHASAPARAPDRAETTRRHILDVAARAFARGGYAGASLNDLIRESGVTKGGFYFHFPSKEALALAVLRSKQEQWAEQVMAAAGRHDAAIDQLAAMPAALVDLYEADPSSRAIPRLTVELSEDPRLAPDMRPMLRKWIELTESVMRRAQTEVHARRRRRGRGRRGSGRRVPRARADGRGRCRGRRPQAARRTLRRALPPPAAAPRRRRTARTVPTQRPYAPKETR
ncbi:MAG: TetR family transcriptional regulator [Actinomycetota bacterium]